MAKSRTAKREVTGSGADCAAKFEPDFYLGLGLLDVIPFPAEQSVSSGRTHMLKLEQLFKCAIQPVPNKAFSRIKQEQLF